MQRLGPPLRPRAKSASKGTLLLHILSSAAATVVTSTLSVSSQRHLTLSRQVRAILSCYRVLAKGASCRHRLELECHNKQAIGKTIDLVRRARVHDASEAQVDLPSKLLKHLCDVQSEATSPHTQYRHFHKHIPVLSECAKYLYVRHVANSHEFIESKLEERAGKLRRGGMKSMFAASREKQPAPWSSRILVGVVLQIASLLISISLMF